MLYKSGRPTSNAGPSEASASLDVLDSYMIDVLDSYRIRTRGYNVFPNAVISWNRIWSSSVIRCRTGFI